MTMAIEKTQYEELTDRQQAFVDSIAELQAKSMEITYDRMVEGMEKQGFEPYSESTFGTYRGLYEDIIEDRMLMVCNERTEYEGDEHVSEGEDGVPVIDGSMTHISERPYEDENEDLGFILELSKDQVFHIIRTADEEIAKEIFKMVMEYDDG